MKQPTTIILGACIAAAVVFNVRGQNPGAIQQVDSFQQRQQLGLTPASYKEGDSAPELYPGESGDVGPQSVLKIKPRKTLFEAMADVQYFYTDNMFLYDHDKKGADVLVSTAQFALAPTPYELGGGQFAPRLGYRQQWFDFGLADSGEQVPVHVFNGTNSVNKLVHLNDFDFNVQTVFTDGRWTRGHWTVEAGFDFTRLLSTSDYDEFYKEYVPRWGVQRNFSFSEKMALSVGYAGDYRFTDVNVYSTSATVTTGSQNFNDRTDQSFFAVYTQYLCQHAYLQPYYQFKYTHFTQEDRNDYLNSLGLSLNWIVCPNCALRGFIGYDINHSVGSSAAGFGFQGYHQLSAGGGVNVVFRF